MTVIVHMKDGKTVPLLHVKTVADLRRRLESIGVKAIKRLEEGKQA